MAEIRVEQKRRSLAWLWILLVLALVAAGVWYFYFNTGGVSTTDTGALTGPAAGATVASATTPSALGAAAPRVA